MEKEPSALGRLLSELGDDDPHGIASSLLTSIDATRAALSSGVVLPASQSLGQRLQVTATAIALKRNAIACNTKHGKWNEQEKQAAYCALLAGLQREENGDEIVRGV